MDKMVQKPNYVEELLEILRGSLAADELQDQISDYHDARCLGRHCGCI